MKRSRRELSINMVIGRLVLKINKVRSFPVLPSCAKQVWDYLKQQLFFAVKKYQSVLPEKSMAKLWLNSLKPLKRLVMRSF